MVLTGFCIGIFRQQSVHAGMNRDTAPSIPRSRSLRWLRILAVCCRVIAVLLFLPAGYVAISAFSIYQNVQAMQLPTPAARTPVAQAVAMPSPLPVTLTPAQTRMPSPPPPTTAATATSQREPTATLLPEQPALTVLLLGVDRRPGEDGPTRTDAIVVARIEPERKRIALLSLPRDLVVDIPGYGAARINAAHVYGELYPQLGGGVDLARRTVSNLLGIPIDHVVVIDFTSFIGVVDAIGGITVDVPYEIYDPAYPTMDYGYTVAHFMPGPQYMDGTTALMYSRTRHADSDFQRMQRQQAVLLAIVARLREQNALQQIQSITGITAALRGYVQTDLSESQLLSLAWSFRNIEPTSIERYTLDGSMVATGVVPGDPYAEIALPGMIERLVQKLLGTNGPE